MTRRLEPKMIEVICNDRLGKKVRVKCKYPFNRDQEASGCWVVPLARVGADCFTYLRARVKVLQTKHWLLRIQALAVTTTCNSLLLSDAVLSSLKGCCLSYFG